MNLFDVHRQPRRARELRIVDRRGDGAFVGAAVLLATLVAASLRDRSPASVAAQQAEANSPARTVANDATEAAEQGGTERDELVARIDALDARLRARPGFDLDALEARTLLTVFAFERGLELDYVTRVESDAGAGELAFSVHGEGSLEAWLTWLDGLDAQGLAVGVEQFRLERDAPHAQAWRVTLRVCVGTPRAAAEEG